MKFNIGDEFGTKVVFSEPFKKGKKKVVRLKCKSCGKETIPETCAFERIKMPCHHCKLSTHGFVKSPTWYSWQAMKNRCNNPNNASYKNYGGKGIKVCKRWNKFENFLEDMGKRPEGTTIDRKNNNRNYCKSNCRWSDSTVQARNRSNTVKIRRMGITLCASEWDRALGLTKNTIGRRIRQGLPIDHYFDNYIPNNDLSSPNSITKS